MGDDDHGMVALLDGGECLMADASLGGGGNSEASERAGGCLGSGGKGGYVTWSARDNDGYETAVVTDFFGKGVSSASRSMSASSTKSFSSK